MSFVVWVRLGGKACGGRIPRQDNKSWLVYGLSLGCGLLLSALKLLRGGAESLSRLVQSRKTPQIKR